VAERLMAEAWESGALGIEERAGLAGAGGPERLPGPDGLEGRESDDGAACVDLVIYFASDAEPMLRRALLPFGAQGAALSPSEAVAEVDWVEAWKVGMVAIEISPRLVVRPSFLEHAPAPGQRTLVIDPGQAFGTGGHASTRLALDWVDALAAGEGGAARPPRRVLDVGTGSGVLAQAALLLGAERAVGFDLDRDAVREAARWARYNGVDEGLLLFAGPIEALCTEPFDCVVANLLKREMLPIADAIAAAVAPGGWLVLSGLLAGDAPDVLEAFGQRGLESRDARRLHDAVGDDWIAPLLQRPAR
jgi:ribosomal protein L11 methyltransferase